MAFDKNITTDGIVDLIPIGSSAGAIESIYIANAANDSALVSVYFEDASAVKFHLINKVVMPTSTALLLTDNVTFSNTVFGLKIKVTASSSTPVVDVLIR